MYRIQQRTGTSILRTEIKSGETIEQKVTRMKDNGEDANEVSTKLIYTDYKDGVNPLYDIRTDKWEIAQAQKDAVARNTAAKVKGAMEEKSSETEVKTGTSESEGTPEKETKL